MSKKQTAVAEQTQAGALALMDFEQYAGSGFETADKDSFAIPMLVILQKMSPQCDPDQGAYIEGAKPGQIMNTVTGDLYDSINVVPCAFKRSFIEWIHRDEGGGFVAEHGVEAGLQNTTTKDSKGNDILPNGHQLVDTRTHFVLLVKEDGSYEPSMISMTSSGLKKSKQWMTTMRGLTMVGKSGARFNPPMQSHQYHLSTVTESNDKGTWKNWGSIGTDSIMGPVTDPQLFQAARDFHDSVMSGAANVRHDQAATAEREMPDM